MSAGQVIGLQNVMRRVTNIGKQMRFAQSQALNDTAKACQQFTLSTLLPSKFTLRSRGTPWQKPGQKFGFNIRFANKLKLEAVMGSQAPWLALHETGGVKTPASSSRLAIPSPEWKPKGALMVRAKKPRQILSGRVPAGLVAKPFVLGTGTNAAIYVQRAEGSRALMRLFSFEGAARIQAVLNFRASNMAVARSAYRGFYEKRLAHAILTAK